MTDAPHFKLARVYDDGTSEPAEIVPLLEIPQDTDMGRRGFLGMGAVFGAGIAATGTIATMPDPAEAAGKKKKKTSSKKKKKPGPLAAHIGIVRAIDLATNGKSIATGGDDKLVKIWSMPDGKLVHTLKGHGQRVTAVAVSASGAFVVSAANERVTRIWRIAEKAAKSQQSSVKKYLKSSSVAVAPDESYALAGLTSGQIKVFDLPSGKTRATLKGHSGSVRAFRFSADGTILMSWATGSVRLWSMPEGRLLRAFDSNKSDPIRAAEMTPDASYLSVATLKGSVTIPALSGLMPLLDKIPYAPPHRNTGPAAAHHTGPRRFQQRAVPDIGCWKQLVRRRNHDQDRPGLVPRVRRKEENSAKTYQAGYRAGADAGRKISIVGVSG